MSRTHWPLQHEAFSLCNSIKCDETYVALDLNGQRSTFKTSDVTWSQKSTLVYTLNPELMHRFMVTDVQITKVAIYLLFTFIEMVFDIIKQIIDYQVDNQIWWPAIWDRRPFENFTTYKFFLRNVREIKRSSLKVRLRVHNGEHLTSTGYVTWIEIARLTCLGC